MSLRYSYKFSQTFSTPEILQYGKEAWVNTLHDVTPEQIEAGINKFLTQEHDYKDWPPTVWNFKDMCKEKSLSAAHKEFIALPTPELNDEQKTKIDEIRDQIRMMLRPTHRVYE